MRKFFIWYLWYGGRTHPEKCTADLLAFRAQNEPYLSEKNTPYIELIEKNLQLP